MLSRPDGGALTIWFDGQTLPASAGDGVAVARLGDHTCMMGVCFDCLAVVDGRANVQTCMTLVFDGMRVQRQEGARAIGST